MKPFLRRAVSLLIIAGVLAGGYWLYRTRLAPRPAAPEVFSDTAVVRRGSLEAVVEVLGVLNAVQTRELTFGRLTGYNELTVFNAVEGDAVAAGDVIAAVDDAPYRQVLDRARRDLAAAEQRLADAQKPPAAAAVAQADLETARAEQALLEAEAALAELRQPDAAPLTAAVRDATDALTLARLQQTLVEHDVTAKAVRDAQYAVDWHGRRANELAALVASGQANLEETAERQAEAQAEAESRVRLAAAEAERRLALATAEQAVREAESALAAAQKAATGATAAAARALALKRSELAVREAEVDLAAARAARQKLDAGPDATKVAAARLEVERRRIALADAEAALAATTLTAPFGGTLIAARGAVGGLVQSDDTVAVLADMSTLQLQTSIDETNIRDIAEGQVAEIVFESLPDVIYTGQVGAPPLQGSVQQDVTYYMVPVTPDGPVDATLRLGALATVRIRTGRVIDGLLVPAMAVQYIDGLTVVLLPDPAHPEEPQRAPVEIGVSDGVTTEIREGVTEGQTVIIPLRSNVPMFYGY